MVHSYYDGIAQDPSTDVVARATDTASSDCGVNNSINQISNMTVNKSMNGSVRGYSYNTTFKNPKGTGDSTPSNFDSTAYRSFGSATGGGGSTRGGGAGRQDRGGGIPNYNRGNGSTSIPATKTSNGFVSGLKDAGGNIVHAVNTVVSGAWAGVSAMAKFGFDISKDLYEGAKTATGDIWNKLFQKNKNLHPDYATIYNEDEHGRTYIHMPVVFDGDKVTFYMPDDAIADIYRMVRDEGFLLPPADPTYTYPGIAGNWVQPIKSFSGDDYYNNANASLATSKIEIRAVNNSVRVAISKTGKRIMYLYASSTQVSGNINIIAMTFYSKSASSDQWNQNNTSHPLSSLPLSYTYEGKTVYYGTTGASVTGATYDSMGNTNGGNHNANDDYYVTPNGVDAWILVYGNSSSTPAHPGVTPSPSPDVTPFDPSNITGTDIPTIIQQMNDTYAPQMGSPIVGTYMDDSCNEVNINYHPVTIPINVGVGDIFPISGGNNMFGVNVNFNQQSNPGIGSGFDLIGTLLDWLSKLTSFDLPDIGDLLSNLVDLKDLLDWILNVLAELFQGAPGGSGISLDPEINITINNYYDNYVPPEPEPTPGPTPEPSPALPPITVNPPIVQITTPAYPDIDLSPVIEFKPNITVPTPTIPIIIPPWPTESGEPEVTPSTGWPTSMWNVYNPTQGEVNSFGAWLWNPNFVDTIKRLFESPIDAVFTLHKVFVTPHTSGSAPIVVGSIASNTTSAVVDTQYVNLDCGEIDLDEFFGNIFDYAPYTILQLYLPFIGIVELDPSYCMRSTVSIYYTVDVFTGACVAKVGCKRDGYDVCVYEFTGSCSVEYPVSYHSYSSIVTSILSGAISATAGAIGTYVSGNPMPAVYGASNAIHQGLSGRSETRHSGSFAGSHGAMGIRKPYLIISRPIIELADNFPYFDGYPANQTVMVSSCAGYIKCKECHLNVPAAYKSELDELNEIFISGVLIY